jgi:RNA polymerase sigma-70 factor (ECF subfamily)
MSEATPHLRALYGTAFRLTRNPFDAEDLVQETLLRAFRAFDRYRPGTNIRSWLFTILRRVQVDAFRKARRRPRTEELMEDSASLPPPQDALASGGEDLARALESLAEPFRLAVILRDLEDLSYQDIARIMECPIGTVMSRIHRGRALLRSVLRERGALGP